MSNRVLSLGCALGLAVINLCLPSAIAAEPVPDVTDLDPNCACVAQGRRWAQGEEVCIAGQSMICGMNQNISSWKNLGQSCQVSSAKMSPYAFTTM
jgi:hypothetical protein